MAQLDVVGLSVTYDGSPAVSDINFSVRSGQILTIIGPNGAGKSSLLNALMCALPLNGRSTGAVSLNGINVDTLSLEQRTATGLSLVPEKRELFSEMSVEDNLLLGAYRFRSERMAQLADRRDSVYSTFPRLRERHRQLAGTLSGGERQMLAIGRALMARPTVLLLDEPSLGLAPLIVRDIFRIVETLREANVAIVLVEQNARAALAIANVACVMELGRTVFIGTAADAARDERTVNTYLGRRVEPTHAESVTPGAT